MATIELKNIKKMYGQVEAIRGVDCSIGNGEMVVLVGPSGCGKSTLLRMIAGLESITSGTLEIAGNDVSRVEPADRDIAMVFQNYALYPHMSVRENSPYGLKNRGMPKDDIARRVAEAADILEIAPLLERRPRQLSGGQRQRVAMGRAIVRNPAAFLFDEPLSNLDAKLRTQMRVEIRRLQRRLKTTSVYVTHDQLEAMTLADRLVVMNAGVIQQIGTPLEVYSKPETLFVASFIGSPPMNLMPLDAIRSTAINLPQLGNGTDVIGVRPDALTLERPDEPAMQLGGIVELVEPLGAEFHVHVRLTETDEVIAAEIPSGRDVTDGGQINLHVRHVDIHRFNSRTERRTDT